LLLRRIVDADDEQKAYAVGLFAGKIACRVNKWIHFVGQSIIVAALQFAATFPLFESLCPNTIRIGKASY
jgi:hypothetical protein